MTLYRIKKFIKSISIVPINHIRETIRYKSYQRKANREIESYLKQSDEPKLQIGCGKNLLNGWLNTDQSFKDGYSTVYMDAGIPFPIPDASFDYVYSEHLFEHLTYHQAMNMLKESYRVLKPGGIMRVATPDLKFLIALYQEPEKPIHKAYIEYAAKKSGLPASPLFIINRFHIEWGHKIIYDRETLTELLRDAGFKEIKPCEVGESEHPALKGIEGHFKVFPYEFNLLETMIFECKKSL